MTRRVEIDRGINLERNPSFFVIGCLRSGLSLLGQLLDAHPLLAVAPDLHWITKHFETRTGLNVEACLAREPVAKWLQQRRFDPFEIPGEEIKRLIELGQLVPVGIFLTRLLDLIGKARGKRLVGSTTPSYGRLMPQVQRLWPGCKFVHLIRDGRDVCLSVLNRDAKHNVKRYATWTEDPLTTVALWWRHKVKQDRHGGRELAPGRYYELRYESLLADPVRECRGICAFLGVPYDDAMLCFHERSSGTSPDNVGQPITAGLRDWSTQMSPSAVERFEAAAGDLLGDLGYRLVASSPDAATRQRVARIKERFIKETGPRSLPQPALAMRRREIGANNPFVFVVGCPRSGTTLLQRLLDAHPELAITDETFWIPYFFKKGIGLTSTGMVTEELISRLFSYYKFYRMRVTPEELRNLLAREEQVSYTQFVSAIFDRYGEFHSKPLVGDKTPDYVRNIATLHQFWPKAKFIHLLRDGRDVCLSAINWRRKAARFASLYSTWEKEPVATAAVWWQWHVRLGREVGRTLPPDRYYEMRYESLVAQPAEECRKLCTFLGLGFADSMLSFHEGRARVDSGQDAKNAWLAITPGLRDWRTQMPPQDCERFEAVAGSLLDELHYPRAFPQPCPEALASATSLADRFAADVQLHGDWLP